MKYVIQVYSNGQCIGWLKSMGTGTFSITKNVKYAKRYKNMDLAQGDCDLIVAYTNGQSIGSIDPLL